MPTAQEKAQIQLKAEVHVYSENLTGEQIRLALFAPSASVEGTLADLTARYGDDCRLCVVPEGPQTIPYVR